MTKVEEIEKAISALPKRDFEKLRDWFSERAWEQWDREVETDAVSGKLHFLVEEAKAAKRYGKLKDL